MDVQCWKLLPLLGGFLYELAVLADNLSFQEYYGEHGAGPARDTWNIANLGTPGPEDLFGVLERLLSGSAPSDVAVPLLAQRMSPCVQRSVDLLTCYAALSEAAIYCASLLEASDVAGVEQCMEASYRRVVAELVQRKWTLAQLDTLPFGVALPLRQALQQCRNNPPDNWPREAYVLVGTYFSLFRRGFLS